MKHFFIDMKGFDEDGRAKLMRIVKIRHGIWATEQAIQQIAKEGERYIVWNDKEKIMMWAYDGFNTANMVKMRVYRPVNYLGTM